jgi:very-short-patch-repair endonuclease
MNHIEPILRSAAEHHGIVHRRHLAALGLTARQVQRLVRQGLLVSVGTATFRVAGQPVGDRQLLLAACLDLGAIASHRSAAGLHGIGRWPEGRTPEVLLARRTSGVLSPIAVVHTTTWLPAHDQTEVSGVPCTSVARTLLQLAGTHEPDLVRGLVDDAIRAGKASDRWLWWHLEQLRRRGRPGIQAMEGVLRARAELGPTESWLERAFLDLLQRNGLPLPRCQRRIERRGTFVGRVDFAYDDRAVVVEVSGHEFHASREQLAADAARRNGLQLAGHPVLEFTYDDVVEREAVVVETMCDALGLPARPQREPGA